MRSVEEALAAVEEAAGIVRLSPERVPLAEALGRVLAEDVAMDHDVPPFRRAHRPVPAKRWSFEMGTSHAISGRVSGKPSIS